MNMTVRQDLWHRDFTIQLDLPDRWNVDVLHMNGQGRKVLGPDDYRQALSPLSPMVRGKKEVCILFDDLSRPTRAYEIVPHLLHILSRSGISDEQVRFVCALGTHAPHDNVDFRKKLGHDVLERFPVYNHNPYENCEYLGKTSLGTPVMINKEYHSCDLRIGIGSFIPHSFCGFGGGSKIVLPAASHIDAIEYHHGTLLRKYWDRAYAIGKYEDNPLLADIMEYGRIVKLDAKIDVLVDEEGRHVDLFAGTPDDLYRYMIPRASVHYGTMAKRKADIVFANAYGKANEAVIALSLAELFLKDEGGTVVVLCDIEGGQVVHYLLGQFGKSTAGRLCFGERQKDGKVKRIFVYCRQKDKANEWWFGTKADTQWSGDLREIVARLDDEYKDQGSVDVAVIPDGTIQMPLRLQ